MSRPLADLSASQQNSRSTSLVQDILPDTSSSPLKSTPTMADPIAADNTDQEAPISLDPSRAASPRKNASPVKYRLQEDASMIDSPPASPIDGTLRINEGLTRVMSDVADQPQTKQEMELSTMPEEGMSTIHHDTRPSQPVTPAEEDTIDFTLNMSDLGNNDETMGDLSTISAIPTDMTRFANLRNSPTKRQDPWSPSKQLRNSVIVNTPSAAQRPLTLVSRNSASSIDDDEATPRRPRGSSDSPTDLLNFTGQSNILIPPPSSAPRTARRSPSGRGAFPIRVNPSPTHRSQASVDRERAKGRSPEKSVPATPASHRHSMYGAPTGFGNDLLDIDLGPMATPRSIPTVTPRELESLRSELQSRISGLEATLSGKEAEVMALKRSITDAEVRAGKISEELRGERVSRESIEHEKEEMERRSREMEEVLREIKQNAFVEEREREKLRRQAEEAERRTEEGEVKILELNASLETLRSDRLCSPAKSKDPATPGTVDVDHAVKNATESVARELHALYKSKHERKVADLKMSYEKRWIKQVEQLRSDVQASQDEVVRLQTEREATMSGIIPGQSEAMSKMEGQIEELRRWNDEIKAQKKVMEAECAGFRSKIETIAGETDLLRQDLEQERVEKGDLVAQIDEFLTLKTEEEEVMQERARTQAALQQPVSPPRSEDGSGHGAALSRHNSGISQASPRKTRESIGGDNVPRSGRARPLSMLQKPTAGKFSSLPPPGSGSGMKAPSSNVGRAAYAGRSGIIDSISRMGANGR